MAESEEAAHESQQTSVSSPPSNWRQRAAWLGPAFLWMVSATGSGEMLFTPRVAAQYGYVLIWALVAAVILKVFINHEIGRYTVATGATLLQGFGSLPGKRKWAVWLIVLPQLIVAPALNAGMAGAAATVLILFLPGQMALWTVLLLVASGGLVLWGKYGGVEKISTYMGIFVLIAIPTTAIIVGPNWSAMGQGLIPSYPSDVKLGEVLPWVGFVMAGAAGMMYYSYWVSEKGYGAAKLTSGSAKAIDPKELPQEERTKVKGWIGQMTLDNLTAAIGVTIPTLGFLILGAELLMPEGLIPKEQQVGEVLGRLLGDVFGQWGFWLMLAVLFVGFFGTLIAQHDGYGRLFADGSREIAEGFGLEGRWQDPTFLNKAYIVVLTTLIPIAIFLWRGNPVQLLQIAGMIEAAHIAIVAALILYLNQRTLPKDLKPNWVWFGGALLAVLFFSAFAILFLLTEFGFVSS